MVEPVLVQRTRTEARWRSANQAAGQWRDYQRRRQLDKSTNVPIRDKSRYRSTRGAVSPTGFIGRRSDEARPVRPQRQAEYRGSKTWLRRRGRSADRKRFYTPRLCWTLVIPLPGSKYSSATV